MSPNTVRRDDVLRKIRALKPEFERLYGVSRIGVFGTVARDQARDDSDIDVVVVMADPDLFFLVHIKEALEAKLGRSVDIVHYRERMNAYLKEHIQNEAVYA
jgi:predicted nucleotidyltransferase